MKINKISHQIHIQDLRISNLYLVTAVIYHTKNYLILHFSHFSASLRSQGRYIARIWLKIQIFSPSNLYPMMHWWYDVPIGGLIATKNWQKLIKWKYPSKIVIRVFIEQWRNPIPLLKLHHININSCSAVTLYSSCRIRTGYTSHSQSHFKICNILARFQPQEN